MSALLRSVVPALARAPWAASSTRAFSSALVTAGPHKDTNLQLLQGTGMSAWQAAELLAKQPHLAHQTLDTPAMRANLKALRGIGLTDRQVGEVFLRQPRLIFQRLGTSAMRNAQQALREAGLSETQITEIGNPTRILQS